jgi:hypothetical protein
MSKRKDFSFVKEKANIPSADHFYKQHAEIHGLSYQEAYNEVLRVMRTFQFMLITHRYFMMPGIGILGLAMHPRRGLMVASVLKWWSPGILTVLAAAPGWENAPLNGYLTPELVKKVNRIISRIAEDKRSIPTRNHFYRNSDLGVPGETLEDLQLADMAADTEKLQKVLSANAEKVLVFRANKNSYVRDGLVAKIKELESALGLPHTDHITLLKEEYDKIYKSGSTEL